MEGEKTGDNGYRYREAAIFPTVIVDLSLELFSGKTVTRREIAEQTRALHLSRGGLASDANFLSQVKKACQTLQERYGVENIGRGHYRFPGRPAGGLTGAQVDPEAANGSEMHLSSDDVEDADTTSESPVPVEAWLGEGGEIVYAYSFAIYRRLRDLDGASTMPIKVGMTRRSELGRVDEQSSTAMAEPPVVLVAIRCSDAAELERFLHSALTLRGRWMENAPGTEWFDTSVDEITSLYRWIMGDSQRETTA